MSHHAIEVWKHAPSILAKLESVINRPKAEAKQELLELLGMSGSSEVVSVDGPSVEDFEYALHSASLDRLEADDDDKVEEVAKMLDVTAAVVVDLFERAAQPGQPQAETERCKNWWSMLLSVAEDVSRLIPVKLLDRFVRDWEESLVQLRAAYLKLAMQRLAEFDAKQEAEQKAAEEAAREAASDAKTPKEQKAKDAKEAKEAKDKEVRRTEERKKMIAQLGISPNGQLYLTLTSLLKQLCSRLCSSLHTPLRARIVLLLERLLAMDHKAIANNQKLRTQEYVQLADLDQEADAGFGVAPASAEETGATKDSPASAQPAGAGATEEGAAISAAAAPGSAPTSLGSDPAVDYQLYHSFWGLQESLQQPEKLFETVESWSTFHKALSTILALFLKYPTQDDAKQPWSPPEPMPLRHAPRSRALAVQLDDPAFRQQFLTQVMIAFQALEQDGSSRRGDGGGIISRQPDKERSEFASLKKVCETALSQTRKGFTNTLKHVFDRESHWVLWKVYGCREFERESLEMLNARISPADKLAEDGLPMRVGKPHLHPYLNSLLKTLKDPQWRLSPAAPTDTSKAARPHAMREMCDRYLDRLIEEEKPENQIDEEYKAKKNKVFMWQARRLFCQQHLRVYAQKEMNNKSDFMDFVRSVKGKPLDSPPDASGAAGTKAAESGAGPAAGADGAAEDSPHEAVAEPGEASPVGGAAASAAPATTAGNAPSEAAATAAAPAVAPAVAATQREAPASTASAAPAAGTETPAAAAPAATPVPAASPAAAPAVASQSSAATPAATPAAASAPAPSSSGIAVATPAAAAVSSDTAALDPAGAAGTKREAPPAAASAPAASAASAEAEPQAKRQKH